MLRSFITMHYFMYIRYHNHTLMYKSPQTICYGEQWNSVIAGQVGTNGNMWPMYD